MCDAWRHDVFCEPAQQLRVAQIIALEELAAGHYAIADLERGQKCGELLSTLSDPEGIGFSFALAFPEFAVAIGCDEEIRNVLAEFAEPLIFHASGVVLELDSRAGIKQDAGDFFLTRLAVGFAFAMSVAGNYVPSADTRARNYLLDSLKRRGRPFELQIRDRLNAASCLHLRKQRTRFQGGSEQVSAWIAEIRWLRG